MLLIVRVIFGVATIATIAYISRLNIEPNKKVNTIFKYGFWK